MCWLLATNNDDGADEVGGRLQSFRLVYPTREQPDTRVLVVFGAIQACHLHCVDRDDLLPARPSLHVGQGAELAAD